MPRSMLASKRHRLLYRGPYKTSNGRLLHVKRAGDPRTRVMTMRKGEDVDAVLARYNADLLKPKVPAAPAAAAATDTTTLPRRSRPKQTISAEPPKEQRGKRSGSQPPLERSTRQKPGAPPPLHAVGTTVRFEKSLYTVHAATPTLPTGTYSLRNVKTKKIIHGIEGEDVSSRAMPHLGAKTAQPLKSASTLMSLARSAVLAAFMDVAEADFKLPIQRLREQKCAPHILSSDAAHKRCKGHLLLPTLTFATGTHKGKHPVNVLGPGDIIFFPGKLPHGTINHESWAERDKYTKAHVSIVMQISEYLFSCGGNFDRSKLDEDMAKLAVLDAKDPKGRWVDAAWIPVHNTHKPIKKLTDDLKHPKEFKADKMAFVEEGKYILYDEKTNEIYTFCEIRAHPETAKVMRTHFEPMKDMHSEDYKGAYEHEEHLHFCAGRSRDELKTDVTRSGHEQRMHYLGPHSDKANGPSRAFPGDAWDERKVNVDSVADLTLYAAPTRQPNFWMWSMKEVLYEELGDIYRTSLPRVSTYLVAMLATVETHRRGHTDIGLFFSSDRLAGFFAPYAAVPTLHQPKLPLP